MTHMKQTVWLLITKLDKSILKLRFLVSKLVATNYDDVIRVSTQAKGDFQHALEQMIVQSDPFLFKKTYLDIQSLYDSQKVEVDSCIKDLR